MMLRVTIIFLCSGLFMVQAGEPLNRTIFGANPSLTAGEQALRMRDYEEGLRLTLKGLNSVTTTRNRASAFNNLCAGYVGSGQFIKALESCDKALGLNSRNWRVYNNRALALLGEGRILAAIKDLEKGLELNPDSPTLAEVASMIDAQARSRVVAREPDSENH